MAELIPHANQIGSLLLNAGWQAALLAICVAAICRLSGRHMAPRWKFILWGVVFIRLACPVLPPSMFSALNLLPDRNPNTSTITAAAKPPITVSPAVQSPGETIRPPQLTPNIESQSTPNSARQIPITVSPQPANSNRFQFNTAQLAVISALALWLIIAAVLLFKQSLQWRRLHAMAAGWNEVSDPQIRQLLEDCRRQLGVRQSVQLLQANNPVGPGTLGLLRPLIVIPASLLQSLTTNELRMLFLHELSHIRRADLLWDRLAALLATFHWFNPFAWWALARLRDAREQSCDAAVLHSLGHQQAAHYGNLVINLADRHSVPRPQTFMVGALGQTRMLKRRIEMIANYRESTWKHSLAGLGTLALLVACGLTSAQSPEQPASPPTTPTTKAASTTKTAPTEKPTTTQQDQKDDYVVTGTCVDENKQPLSNVRVRLFLVDLVKQTRQLVMETTTKTDGHFRFDKLADLRQQRKPATRPVSRPYYVVAATSSGRASWLNLENPAGKEPRNITVEMPPAGKLSGRVTDEQGQPVAGSQVFVQAYPFHQPIDGILSDVTDDEGRYAITDAKIWDAAKEKPQAQGNGEIAVATEFLFNVHHPNYGATRPTFNRIPAVVNVTLQPAAVIEGKIIDQVTGQPAAGATVAMQGIHPTIGFQRITTDNRGHYRFTSVEAGVYNVWAETDERTCIAIDSLKVEKGQTYTRNITLIEGAWLEGRVIRAETGKPLSQVDGQQLGVGNHGPSRPKSGAAVISSPVDENGRFSLRVPPGKNFPYIMMHKIWQRTEDAEEFRNGINVADGELVILEFRVLEQPPRKKPKFSPVRLSIPVPAEREAAAAVRRLGGWYQLDDDKHVIEINMVYHSTKDKVRYENDQVDTDEILRWVPQFPRLKRLLLKENQASDDSMQHVAKLAHLEVFYVWDAHNLSDAGVQQLRTLKKLKNIHISESTIGDGALRVFGELPKLESLSLQGNRFTDAGVPHLSRLTQLKSLWIGMGDNKLSDRALPHLAGLQNLEALSLQRVPLTDAGIEHLKPLTKLRTLNLGGGAINGQPAITDASVSVLSRFKSLESLMIQKCRFTDDGVRKLAALPKLKRLSVEGTAVTRETKAELKQKYPDIWINIPLRSE